MIQDEEPFVVRLARSCNLEPSTRLALFRRDLLALTESSDGMLIFNPVGDEDTFIQFSRREGEPLFCEVSNRSEGWNSHSLDTGQRERLTALGYEIPSPHHQANPRKPYNGPPDQLAAEVEQIFREVFSLPQEYAVVSSGILPTTFE